MIETLQTDIYTILNNIHETYIDELPTREDGKDFDFSNIGCFYNLNISNSSGNRNTFTMQIYLISNKINKLQMQTIAENINNVINNKVLSCNAIIRHPEIWINSFIDNQQLQNILLTYIIDKF